MLIWVGVGTRCYRIFPLFEDTMTTTHTIQMLTRYNAWANKAIFEAIAALPGGEATKERPTLFKNMVNTLNHLHVVDLIWQAHIEGRDHGIQALNTVLYTDLTELWRAQQAIDAWYIAWAIRYPRQPRTKQCSSPLLAGSRVKCAEAKLFSMWSTTRATIAVLSPTCSIKSRHVRH
jgi:hypothetical protein